MPEEWLASAPGEVSAAERRAGYVEFLSARLAAAPAFLEEAVDARAQLF